MKVPTHCVACGEFVLMVATKIYAGWYPCPSCSEGALYIPESKLTPVQRDGREIVPAFEVLNFGPVPSIKVEKELLRRLTPDRK